MSPEKPTVKKQAVIKVVGVGGAGNNAVNRMIQAGIQDVEFIAINTDAQHLEKSQAPTKLHIGENTTGLLGAGGDPEKGRLAAEESKNQIRDLLMGADLVFITAGMGGGTGTGASPIVAELARDIEALTVAVVTKPFSWELGRMARAERGIAALTEIVDTIITIPNDRLQDVAPKGLSFVDAYGMADDVLRQGVQAISEIITVPGYVNVDFADVRMTLAQAGPALMGVGVGKGDQRAMQAANAAVSNPLLETELAGATRLLVNVTAPRNFELDELTQAMSFISSLASSAEANIIVGNVLDESLEDEVRITVLAAGLDPTARPPEPTRASTTEAERTPRPTSRIPADGARRTTTPQRSDPPEPRQEPVERNVEGNGSSIPPGADSATGQPRPANPKPADEEEDLNIPTFLRRHRKQRSEESD